LLGELCARIAERGPITFAEYMEAALYHPEFGYYARKVPGADYQTSPTISPLFGRCLSRSFQSMWDELGRPEEFTVCEAGGGGGQLAADAFDAVQPPFADALRWLMVEPRPAIEALQRERLNGLPVEWARSFPEPIPTPLHQPVPQHGAPKSAPAGFIGCVLANEVLDNFPVHLVRQGSALEELYVTGRDGKLAFEPGPPAPEVEAYVERWAGPLAEGQIMEVCLGAGPWIERAAASLERGYLLVIDYGDTVPALYRGRPRGTLLAYERERIDADPLDNPGEADITSHVNFSALMDAGGRAGLRTETFTTQREFLFRLGLRDDLDALRDEANALGRAGGRRALELHAARSAGALLVASPGLGTHKVLVMAKTPP
jgi:SAM-dependent MidA family methyltransferase